MYLDLQIKEDEIIDKEKISSMVSYAVMQMLEEQPERLEKLVNECLKGAVKSVVVEIVQSREYKEKLTNKIMEILEDKEL